jgi:hypothetical protein
MPRNLLAAAAMSAFGAVPAAAWDRTGHEAVALAAWQAMSPEARERAGALLGGGEDEFRRAATWADRLRISAPETGRLHVVNIPLEADRYDASRDCAGGTRCAVGMLEAAFAVLRDGTMPGHARANALRFAIHLVADLHQPLHAVDMRQEPEGLHRTWDSMPGRLAGPRTRDQARQLAGKLASDARGLPPGSDAGTPADWATETHLVARKLLDPARPAAAGRADEAVAERQLALAAARTATFLNQSLGGR